MLGKKQTIKQTYIQLLKFKNIRMRKYLGRHLAYTYILLCRSSKCAADAEEISEELDDLENCLNNRPVDRLEKLKLLATSLSDKDVLISPVQTEADRLQKRWQALEYHTKNRIKSLEGM